MKSAEKVANNLAQGVHWITLRRTFLKNDGRKSSLFRICSRKKSTKRCYRKSGADIEFSANFKDGIISLPTSCARSFYVYFCRGGSNFGLLFVAVGGAALPSAKKFLPSGLGNIGKELFEQNVTELKEIVAKG